MKILHVCHFSQNAVCDCIVEIIECYGFSENLGYALVDSLA